MSSIKSLARRYDMPSDRPALEIEPLSPTASSRRILPGPTDRRAPKSIRRVSLVSLTPPAPVQERDHTSGPASAEAHGRGARAHVLLGKPVPTFPGHRRAKRRRPSDGYALVDAHHHVARLDHRIGRLADGELQLFD